MHEGIAMGMGGGGLANSKTKSRVVLWKRDANAMQNANDERER